MLLPLEAVKRFKSTLGLLIGTLVSRFDREDVLVVPPCSGVKLWIATRCLCKSALDAAAA
jgi:hypothetical protein